MKQVTKFESLILSQKNIFSLQDINAVWKIASRKKLLELIKYYIRTKRLMPLRRGLYAINTNFSELEIAQKLIPLSYISLYTALGIHGINFQYYQVIHSIAIASKKITSKNCNFIFHQIKTDIFYNATGLINEGHYTIASPERAICDTLYLYPQASFDNLSAISKNRLKKVIHIYENKRLLKSIHKLIKDYDIHA